ncbi:MAG: isoaspartyl peptidase/L-asparaginase [Oligoflexales bacterium]
MTLFSGKLQKSILLLHGGAGPVDPKTDQMTQATAELVRIAKSVFKDGGTDLGIAAVASALRGMEDTERFNAGYGSALQKDGVARLSAALMSGQDQKFSGVISVSQVKHPSDLALELQNRNSRVLTQPGAEWLARELGLPVEDLVSPKRLERWYQRKIEKSSDTGHDTVGAVFAADKRLFAGTSTGGRGFEVPGRISDSATVAGNYASPFAAISATGIGEEIVDDGLCVRIETRCRDGLTLKQACEKTLEEATQRGRSYGWIAVSSTEWVVAFTTSAMSFVVLNPPESVVLSS